MTQQGGPSLDERLEAIYAAIGPTISPEDIRQYLASLFKLDIMFVPPVTVLESELI